MDIIRRFVRNTVFLSIATGIERLVGFGFVLFLTRFLTPQEIGVYFVVVSIFFLFQNPVSNGLTQLVTRVFARDGHQVSQRLGPLIVLGSGFGVLIAVLMLCSALLFLDDLILVRGLLILSLGLVPSGLRSVFTALFNGIEELEYAALVTMVGSLLRVVASVMTLWLGFGLQSVFVIMSLTAWAIVLLYCVVIWRRFGLVFDKAMFATAYSYLKPALIVVAITVVLVSVNEINIFIIAKAKPVTAAGSYALAFRLLQAIFIIRPIIMGAIFPTLVQAAGDSARLKELSLALWRVTILLFFPLPVLLLFWSELIIELLYGTDYLAAVTTLQILAWTLPLSFLAVGVQRILLAQDKEFVALKASFWAIAGNSVLAYVLVGPYGEAGPALASVFASVIHLLIMFRSLLWADLAPDLARIFARPLLAIGAAGVLVWTVTTSLGETGLVAGIVFALLYVVFLFLFGAATIQELSLLTAQLLKQFENRFV